MGSEADFQYKLKLELSCRLPGCIVLKNDPSIIQGFPDLLILYKDTWIALECKKSKRAAIRPNQEYYISQLNNMSMAFFIYPENKKEVLDEIQQTLRFRK